MLKSIGARTLLYPTPVMVVGTFDQAGHPNVMTAAWGGICCSVPPCVAVSLRKATYTHGNIVAQQCFTINIPSESQAREVDYFGLVSGRTEDKFGATLMTPVKSELVNAPYVKEFPLILECRLKHTLEIGLHTQFIGEILDIKADESIIGENNITDIQKLKPLIYDADQRRYFGLGPLVARAFTAGKEL